MDLYELNEQEAEMLLGGSPVRQILSVRHLPTANVGLDNARYQSWNANQLHVIPPQNQWQQPPAWVHVGEEKKMNRFYYSNNE
jgi:UDP:flavonoid glycosyltransferase YjiC (YdhE family)